MKKLFSDYSRHNSQVVSELRNAGHRSDSKILDDLHKDELGLQAVLNFSYEYAYRPEKHSKEELQKVVASTADFMADQKRRTPKLKDARVAHESKVAFENSRHTFINHLQVFANALDAYLKSSG